MIISPFLDSERQLRNGWWVLIFFIVLASFLVPVLLLAEQRETEVTISGQAVIIAIATCVCQWLRRKPLTEITGKLNLQWCKELWLGGLIGATLMLIPALILGMFGWVNWKWNPAGFSVLSSSFLLFAGVAIAEELLFRGFIFQRLLSGAGQWPAQLIIAVLFLFTHLNNPGMTGSVKVMASGNIFLASIMFGLVFIRTRGLAMPLGLHLMANWMSGGILGLGVSGTEQAGLLKPIFGEASAWLTGGQFGLEASLPGLICVVITLLILYIRQPTTTDR
jgi:uncharacterized protein